jgi:predicted dehydrogenase
MPQVKPLRIACIGCGFIGHRHMENARAMPGVEPAAHADVHRESAELFLRDFGGDYSTTDPDRIFDDKSIDAVVIATHHDSHLPLALEAAAAGKHILLEKPMALNVADCRTIAAAAVSARITLTLNFKFRFTSTAIRARQAIPSPIATHGQLAMPRMPRDIWVRDPIRGGGLVLATACHVLDMVCWLNRSEPVRVYAEQAGGTEAVAATVRFASGSVASLLLADEGEDPHAGKWLHEMFDGTRSAVLYDHFRQLRLSAPDEHVSVEEDLRSDGTWGVLGNFANAIATGTQPAVTAEDGIRATLLAIRLLDSLRSGTPQDIEP